MGQMGLLPPSQLHSVSPFQRLVGRNDPRRGTKKTNELRTSKNVITGTFEKLAWMQKETVTCSAPTGRRCFRIYSDQNLCILLILQKSGEKSIIWMYKKNTTVNHGMMNHYHPQLVSFLTAGFRKTIMSFLSVNLLLSLNLV